MINRPSSEDEKPAYDLPCGRLLRLQRACGWVVHCEAGELLLTQEGDVRDFVLRAGDSMVIATAGRVLAEATPNSIRSPAQARLRLVACESAWPGQPVVRLLAPRVRVALDRVKAASEAAQPLTPERVFGEPRLLEQLVKTARHERNLLMGSCLQACAGAVAQLAAQGASLLYALRPRLPSLHETLAARVFLRSRL